MAQATLVSERLCGDLQQPISAMAWSVDGEFLAITSTGGELLLLDFRAGCEELLRGDHDSSLDVVGFSGDGQFLMAAGHGSHPPGQWLDRCGGLAAGWLTGSAHHTELCPHTVRSRHSSLSCDQADRIAAH